MGFSGQEYWSGLPGSPPVNLPDPGIKPTSLAPPAWQTESLTTELPGMPKQVALLKSQTVSRPQACHLDSAENRPLGLMQKRLLMEKREQTFELGLRGPG